MKYKERIVWSLLLGITIAWGAWSHRQLPGSGMIETSDSSGTEGLRNRSRPKASAPAGTPSSRRAQDQATGTSDARARALVALRSPDSLTRMSAFLEVLSSCNARNIDLARNALDELKADGLSFPAEEALLDFRSGQLKGAALFADRGLPPDDPAARTVIEKQFEGWVQESPQEASQWLSSLPAGKYRDNMTVSFVASSTKTDPVGALKLVSSLRPSQQSLAGQQAGKQLSESLTPSEASSLLSVLETNAGPSDTSYLTGVFESLAGRFADGNEQLAGSFAEKHLDQPYVDAGALSKISAAKAKLDPINALEWAYKVEELKGAATQGTLRDAAVGGMTLEGVATAEEWVEKMHLPENDGLRKALEKQKDLLMDHRGDANEYDRDD